MRMRLSVFMLITFIASIFCGSLPARAEDPCSKYLEFANEFVSDVQQGRATEMASGRSASGYSFMLKTSHPVGDVFLRVVGIKDLSISSEDYLKRLEEDKATTARWLREQEGRFDEVIAEFSKKFGVEVIDDRLQDLTEAVMVSRGHVVLIREVRLKAEQFDAKLLAILLEMLETI